MGDLGLEPTLSIKQLHRPSSQQPPSMPDAIPMATMALRRATLVQSTMSKTTVSSVTLQQQTTAAPSPPAFRLDYDTFDHKICGFIFNFSDMMPGSLYRSRVDSHLLQAEGR
jgi:hypothetical protein